MAPRAHEQPEKSMGSRESRARRAQTHPANDEGAARGAADPRTAGDARGCRWAQETGQGRLDVLWSRRRADGHHGRNGGLSVGQATHRSSDQGYGAQEVGEGRGRGKLHGLAKCKHCAGYPAQDPRGPYARHQETGTGCL